MHKRAVQARVGVDIARLAFRRYGDPVRATRCLHRLARLRTTVRGGRPTPKIVKVGRRYFTHLYAPGWPSATFEAYIDNEFTRLDDGRPLPDTVSVPPPASRVLLQSVILAVTKQCPLRCEHCFEWDVLNREDVLSTEALSSIVERFQALGVTQVQFSGGEPLTRADDIARIVAGARPGTDFWILTSGVGLTPQRARHLRRAGLTGVCVSLDHWNADRHNAFRGSDRAFEWVERAARAARGAELALCLTLCPTRDFVGSENLARYAETASRLGAGFIQILEPRPVGHFAGRDVALRPSEQVTLDRFFEEFNFSKRHRSMPIVVYPEMAKRRLGCLGSASRYAYVDTDGQVHPCPFCRRPSGSALDANIAAHLTGLRHAGCPAVEPASAA
jgi:MoaA/NifB/PqqE/SkfB family radical SAM enzyme